jgi:hypothetical protein
VIEFRIIIKELIYQFLTANRSQSHKNQKNYLKILPIGKIECLTVDSGVCIQLEFERNAFLKNGKD